MPGNTNYLYQYIAANNPGLCMSLIRHYGYNPPQPKNFGELGRFLEQLKDNEGEAAFRDMMDLHPEKDLILEMYAPAPEVKALAADGHMDILPAPKPCGCGCQDKQKNNFSNADGAAATTSHSITAHQTGMIMLASAVVIAFAIMAKK